MADLTPLEQDVENLFRLATAPGTSTSEFKGAITASIVAVAMFGLAWVNPSGKVTSLDQLIISSVATGATGLVWTAYGWMRTRLKTAVMTHPAISQSVYDTVKVIQAQAAAAAEAPPAPAVADVPAADSATPLVTPPLPVAAAPTTAPTA